MPIKNDTKGRINLLKRVVIVNNERWNIEGPRIIFVLKKEMMFRISTTECVVKQRACEKRTEP